MRGERRLLLPLAAAAGAVLCCAAPGLAGVAAGLGLGAWLGAHGSWVLGLGAVADALAGGAVATRRRRSRRCAR